MKFIKNFLLIVAFIFVIIILAAIMITNYLRMKESTTQPQQSSTQNTTVTQTTTYKIGDSVQSGDYVLTVHGIADNVPPETDIYDRPKEGNKYYAVEVTVENKGSDVISYNVIYFKLQDSEGYTYDYTGAYKKPWFGYGDLQPGRKVRGWITFEIPKNSSNLELIFQPITNNPFNAVQIIVELH
jgi:hypothetical protein